MRIARRMARFIGVACLLVGSLLITSCGSSVAKGHKALAAQIRNYKFSPALVVIHKGDSVVWTNKDTDQHSVTADSGQVVSFDSSGLHGQASFRKTFTALGVFHYHCKFHPFMTGTVTVKA